MKLIKFLGFALVGIVLLFVFLANYSSVETKYECAGTFTVDGAAKPAQLFFRLEKYQPWVRLWSDSDGSIWLEIPNEHVAYFDNLKRIADSFQIWESQYSDKSGIKGNFSTLSNSLTLDTYKGLFEGYCDQLG